MSKNQRQVIPTAKQWSKQAAWAIMLVLFGAFIGSIGILRPALIAASPVTSDVEPPFLATMQVQPHTIDTSLSAQTITITVRITDNLSGCPQDNWCLALNLAPLGGPVSQNRSATFGNLERISGVPIDGIYQATVVLPQYSFEGAWAPVSLQMNDSAGNYCFWSRDPGFVSDCPLPIPQATFLNWPSPNREYLPAVRCE